MTMEEFRRRMLSCALGAGKSLCEMTLSSDIEKESEQVRKNVATILVLLTETEDFMKNLRNDCSNSTI